MTRTYSHSDFNFNLEKLSESLHSFSFQSSGNPPRNSLNLSPQHQTPMNQSLNASWQFYKFIGGNDENAEQVFNGSQRKPVRTIHFECSVEFVLKVWLYITI